ncbi:hypothetical protein D3C87_1094980 [compost metagenome]
MKNLIFLMLSLTLLAACAQSDGDSKNTVKKTVKIQGMLPADYYNQFLYKGSKDCGNKDYFKYINSDSIALLDRYNDHEIHAELYIYLNPDGTFSADYEESEILARLDESRISTKPIQHQTIYDRWSVTEDGEILLGRLGRGRSLIYNERPAIELEYGSFFADKSVRYKDVILRNVSSSAGMRADKRCGRTM